MSENLFIKAEKYIFPQSYLYPPLIVKGRGIIVEDVDGNTYIDASGGPGCLPIGHCHPEVIDAVKEQLHKLTQPPAKFYNIPFIELAERICEHLPGQLKKIYLGNTGAEAVEGAVKLAKRYAFKKGSPGSGIISLQTGFHGKLALTSTLCGLNGAKKNQGTYANYPGVMRIPSPYCYRCPLGSEYPECDVQCAELLRSALEQGTGDAAAFIYEPVQGVGGVIVPPKEYHQKVSSICKDLGILLLVDEVFTGFGRTGKMFASEHWPTEPDILVMGKAIGGGLPLSGFAATETVATSFDKGDHSSTFSGNALCCAAGLATLGIIIKENLVKNAERIGQYLLTTLREMAERSKIVGDVRGLGLFIGMEIVNNKVDKNPTPEKSKEIQKLALKKGLIVTAGLGAYNNVIRVLPPLITEQSQARKIAEILSECVTKIEQK